MILRVADVLRAAAAGLVATSETPRLDAELLMAHAMGVSRSDLLLRHMEAAAAPGFADLIARRKGHEPVAYILGHQEFYGLDLIVTPAVLIPRGDSEVLVDAALKARPAARRVLDCGTGSGALLLAVLSRLGQAAGIGIDRAVEALRVAERNAASLHLDSRAALLQRDWSQPGWNQGLGQFDLILANPPYVEQDAVLSPSVRDHEPSGALFAGAQGLDDYRLLLPQLPALLAPGGMALVEIGADQADAVSKIARAAGFCVTVLHDLAGRTRAVQLEF